MNGDLDVYECPVCFGKGWNYEMHQVAERKSDQQEFKIYCDSCDGLGLIGPDIEIYNLLCAIELVL